jgi:endogenous inhibitor of DNA gyrase (YacG/DUF329 family)
MTAAERRGATAAPPAKKRACPICGKPAQPEFTPFCSRRCADVDLNRWLSGAYVIPGAEDERGTPGDSDD